MLGAVIADMILKHACAKSPILFPGEARITPSAVLTAAAAEGMLDAGVRASSEEISSRVRECLRRWVKAYPEAGFEETFTDWCEEGGDRHFDRPCVPPAFHTSPAGWLYGTLERTRAVSDAASYATHSFEVYASDAGAVSEAVYMARTGEPKEKIRERLEREFGFDFSEPRGLIFTENYSCENVRLALKAFMDGEGFEDVILRCAGLGAYAGASVAGALAESFYGIPAHLISKAREYLPSRLLDTADRLYAAAGADGYEDPIVEARKARALSGSDAIAAAIDRYNEEPDRSESLKGVLEALRFQMHRGKSLVCAAEYGKLPDSIPEDASIGDLLTADVEPGKYPAPFTHRDKDWIAAFTDQTGCDLYGLPVSMICSIKDICEAAKRDDVEGLLINNGSGSFTLSKELIWEIQSFESRMRWHVPGWEDSVEEGRSPEDAFRTRLQKFYYKRREIFKGNEKIVRAITLFKSTGDEFRLEDLAQAILGQMKSGTSFLMPLIPGSLGDSDRAYRAVPFTPRQLRDIILPCGKKGSKALLPVFTDVEQFCKGDLSGIITYPIRDFFRSCLEWDDDFTIVINPYDDASSFYIDQDEAKQLVTLFDKAEKQEKDDKKPTGPDIGVTLGDITDISGVDVIVNSANHGLSDTGGAVNEAVHRAAGAGMKKECLLLGGCETGMAKITSAHGLPYKAVIHTVGPKWNGGGSGEAEALMRCYENSLQTAAANGLKRIAFPAVSAGMNGFPLQEAARTAAKAIRNALVRQDLYGSFDLIEWVVSDQDTFLAYQKELERVFGAGEK